MFFVGEYLGIYADFIDFINLSVNFNNYNVIFHPQNGLVV